MSQLLVRPGCDPLHPPALPVASLAEMFQSTSSRLAGALALGTLQGEQISWGEYAQRVRHLALGLGQLGVEPGDGVALMLSNRPEHFLADMATLHLRAYVATVYPTLPAEEIAYVARNSASRFLVVEDIYLESVTEAVLEHGLDVKLVCVGSPGDATVERLAKVGRSICTLVEVEAAGRDADSRTGSGDEFERRWRAVRADDLALIVHTSGSTGRPKAVQLSHSNLLHSALAFAEGMPEGLPEHASLISAFPLAHAGERITSYYWPLVRGHFVCFSPEIRRIADAYRQIRPHVAFMTPRLLEKAKAATDAYITRVSDAAHRDKLLNAVEVGQEYARAVYLVNAGPDPELVGRWEACAAERRELLELNGFDRMCHAGIGAAPVSTDLLTFFMGLGMPLSEGYGLTEATALCTGSPIGQQRIGFCGVPLSRVAVKLADDGEILIGGPCVMVSYRNDPKATAEVIDANGWLHTGDLGQIEDGMLRIVGRRKEIIINSSGKNMSPSQIEAKLKTAGPLVGQAVVVGDGRPHNVAVLTLDPEGVATLLERNRITTDGPWSQCPEVLAAVADEVDLANSRMSPVERIRNYVVLDDEWLPGGDEVTPTMKLRRPQIISKYAKRIEDLYEH